MVHILAMDFIPPLVHKDTLDFMHVMVHILLFDFK